MQISEPRLRTLLRRAEKVAASGKRTAAIKLYHQIIEEAPEAEAAWLGLAEVSTNPAEKEAAYERVLQINPENDAAQAGLGRLRHNLTTTPPATMPDEPFEQSRAWLELATARQEEAREMVETAVPKPAPATTFPHHEHEHSHEEEDGRAGDEDEFDLVCYRHPNRETALRCYTCGRPICSECAVKTPVGYRCPVCIREAEDVFFNAKPLDYIVAPLAALPLSLIAGFLVWRIGGGLFFIFLMLFVGGAVGSLIGRMAKGAVGRRRGRYLPHVVAMVVALGVLLPAVPILIALLLGNLGALTALITPGLYLFVASSAAFYRMK